MIIKPYDTNYSITNMKELLPGKVIENSHVRWLGSILIGDLEMI